jgi:hypothetical protein
MSAAVRPLPSLRGKGTGFDVGLQATHMSGDLP